MDNKSSRKIRSIYTLLLSALYIVFTWDMKIVLEHFLNHFALKYHTDDKHRLGIIRTAFAFLLGKRPLYRPCAPFCSKRIFISDMLARRYKTNGLGKNCHQLRLRTSMASREKFKNCSLRYKFQLLARDDKGWGCSAETSAFQLQSRDEFSKIK